MEQSEVLVAAHRLRRAAPRNADVLAVTDWVIGGGAEIEAPDAGRERLLRGELAEKDAELGRLRAEVAVLQALAARGECKSCVEKGVELAQVREVLRRQNALNDERYYEIEKLKGEVVAAGGGECPVCAARRATDKARQGRRRARLLERRQTPGEDDRRKGERSAEWHEKHKAGIRAYQERKAKEGG